MSDKLARLIPKPMSGAEPFLIDGRATGFAVSANNPEAIKAAVERILSKPEETRATVDRARELAIAKYDWNLIAARMKQEVFDPLFTPS